MSYNKLLERQLKRKLKGVDEIPEEFKPLLQAISDSYDHYESDRTLLERSLELSSNELTETNGKLRHANEEIAEKNAQIIDSIKYAQRIQSAILPPDRLVTQKLSKSFILYLPKDIVAGDFYWMETVEFQDSDEHLIIFAAADCTGHGVPGAMVSVVCHNALNRAVREYGLTEPATILDKVLEIVLQQFEKSEEEVKDGMDIALCSFNSGTNELQFAGAHNPLWVISSEEKDWENVVQIAAADLELDAGNYLYEIKPDKQPIGKYADPKPFTNHSLKLEEGDTIYIFSDGLPDQFGGPRGKKFKYKTFKQLLMTAFEKNMTDQKEMIHQRFEDWRGDLEQIDDVCVIGMRV